MSKPTMVLVHGAFGDASSWRSAFEHLDGLVLVTIRDVTCVDLRGIAEFEIQI